MCEVAIDDDVCEVAIDDDVCEVIDGVIDGEIFEDVASEYDLFNHDLSFLILFLLAVLFGPTMPWGLVPELPELGDALAADEWLLEEHFEVEGGVAEAIDYFELDA